MGRLVCSASIHGQAKAKELLGRHDEGTKVEWETRLDAHAEDLIA